MRVGLNLLYLLPGVVGGTETYARALMSALDKVELQNEYVVFVNREAASFPLPDERRFTRVVCGVGASNRLARYEFEQLALPREVARHGVELLHSLGYVGPLRPRCRHVVTIHDLNYRSAEVAMPRLKRMPLGFFVRQSARRAEAVITMSEFSKRQIVASLGVDERRVSVTYLAPSCLGRSADSAQSPSQLDLPHPYIVAFGSLSPHKNLPALIRAFGLIAHEIPHALVIVGHIPADSSVREAVAHSPWRERIVVTGYVPQTELERLLGAAQVMAFPSLYEGFGLPLLDAQAAGVAVAASTAASIPEIAGLGAAFFNPKSDRDIAESLRRCIFDVRFRAELIKLGHENVARFAWDKTAAGTIAVYENLRQPNIT